MKKSTLILILLLTVILPAQNILRAQESDQKKKENFWRRVSVGGNLGFQFGSVAGIVVSPEVMVRLVDQLYGGLGFTYEYNHLKNYYVNFKTQEYYDLNVNIFGGRIYMRYYLASIFPNSFLGNIFAHAEYEYLTYTLPFSPDQNGDFWGPNPNLTYSMRKSRIEVNSLFVGGGYKQPLSQKAFLDLLILFNLNYTYESPYSNPIIRLGFGYQL